ncbi:MAG TPA: hypothetical protein VGL94_09755 [Ktedonobacteraceae bacterium]|jgi:hypothetical protein
MEKNDHNDVTETPLSVRQEPYTPLPSTRNDISFASLPTLSAVPLDESLKTSPMSAELAQSDQGELALRKLNDAAQHIAAEEALQQHPGIRVPRLSRLAPYDFTADIRRGSTLLPHSIYSTQPMPGSEPNNKPPDLGAWLQDLDDEGERDIWKDQTDPLLARRFPSISEIKRIEAEDIRQAVAAGLLDASSDELQAAQDTVRLRTHKRLRLLFTFLVILAIFALTFDTMLVLFTALRLPQPHQPSHLPPSITLSANVVHNGQTLTLSIHNFSPSAQVALTRDIEEPVFSGRNSKVSVQADGSQKVLITIDNTWRPGWHTLHAEDTTLHYTASATLRMDAGTTRPSLLLVSPTTLDFDAGIVGADTLRQLTLQNEGTESLSWTATSDQSWLSIGPNNGIFSTTMQITVGVARANLLPGDYTGTISITANGEAPQSVSVQMKVLPLPRNAGAVLAISPAVLPFTTVDGMADPGGQSLVVSNPGTQPLYWMLAADPSSSQGSGSGYQTGWLDTNAVSGIVMPQSTSSVNLSVYSRDLLSGIYSKKLVFRAQAGFGALNNPETIDISLSVRPSCGLALSTGNLTFTAVAGSNPNTQALSLAATDSCSGMISWRSVTSVPWLTITPAGGQLNGISNAVMTVDVDTTNLKPGTYFGYISIAVGQQSTQSVAVQLAVQAPLLPSAPIIAASPLNLNVSLTLGQQDPPGQLVTITNTGGSLLNWNTSVTTSTSSWLGVSPTGGTIAPGQTGQLQVNVNAANLSPGTYVGQIQINGVDGNNVPAGGSPQTITVTFMVQPPCTLAPPSSKALAFSATQGQSDPAAQSIILTASGNCGWPLSWKAAAVGSAPSWLKFTPVSGSFANSNQTATLKIAPSIAGLSPGTYSAQVSISALDALGQTAQGSPQTFTVTLNVTQPCSLQVGSTSLSFTVQQGQTSTGQNVPISSTGSCALPISWSGSGNTTWLVLSPTSGTDQGSGSSLGVSVNAAQLTAGSYTGVITLSATDKSGAAIVGSPKSISVSITVTSATATPTA